MLTAKSAKAGDVANPIRAAAANRPIFLMGRSSSLRPDENRRAASCEIGRTGEQRRRGSLGQMEMPRYGRTENGPEIAGDRQIALLIQPILGKAWPRAVHLAADHIAAQEPHRRAVAMVGAAISVLMHGTAEFGHHD